MKESKIRYSVFFGIFLVILTSLTGIFGQEFRGTITGTLSDPNGAAVAGATVVDRKYYRYGATVSGPVFIPKLLDSRNDDGRRINVATENVIVRGCKMKDGHGGITIGSEISGGGRNVFGENCTMDSPNLDHALRVKNNASRGGQLENFYFRNITIGQVAHAIITIDFNYEEGAKGKYKPVMRNFTAENIRSGKSEFVLDAQGFENAPIENITIKNSTFENVGKGIMAANLKDTKIENVRVNGKLIKNIEEIAVKVMPTKKS